MNDLPLPVLGPIQEEDKLLLQAVIKMTLPKLVLEFGFLGGASSRAILEALPHTSDLHSIDIEDRPEAEALELEDLRFTFFKQSQTEPIRPLNDPVDLVFLDASHEFKANVATYSWLEPLLSKTCILAVHDTGFWPYNPFESFIWGKQTEEGYAHRPDEQTFVRYLVSEGWHRINFGTTKTFRHGMTLLQR